MLGMQKTREESRRTGKKLMRYLRSLRPLQKRSFSSLRSQDQTAGDEDAKHADAGEALVAVKQGYGRGQGLVAIHTIRCAFDLPKERFSTTRLLRRGFSRLRRVREVEKAASRTLTPSKLKHTRTSLVQPFPLSASAPMSRRFKTHDFLMAALAASHHPDLADCFHSCFTSLQIAFKCTSQACRLLSLTLHKFVKLLSLTPQ